jgi:hypothetical protein
MLERQQSGKSTLPIRLGAVVLVMSGPMVLASLTREKPWYDPAADDWYPTEFVQRNIDRVVSEGAALR